jgi:hypothetical protein
VTPAWTRRRGHGGTPAAATTILGDPSGTQDDPDGAERQWWDTITAPGAASSLANGERR